MSRTLARDRLVLDRAAYLADVRPELRARLIPLRASRRARLGDSLALEFENSETLLYQVQEMLMVEGVVDESAVTDELDAYSRLLPESHSLCATLFIEAGDVTTVKEELRALSGIQHSIRLEVSVSGGPPRVIAGLEVPGPDEEGPSEITHAVHFLRFSFDDQSRDAFRDPSVVVELVVEHPAYAAAVPLEGDLRLLLLADLSLEQ